MTAGTVGVGAGGGCVLDVDPALGVVAGGADPVMSTAAVGAASGGEVWRVSSTVGAGIESAVVGRGIVRRGAL